MADAKKLTFEHKPLEWNAAGVEPSADLKTNGFKTDDSPTASGENFYRNRTYAAIKELQEKAAGQNVDGKSVTWAEHEYISQGGCEIFNCSENVAGGMYTHAEGFLNYVDVLAGHVEGGNNYCLAEYGHAENQANKVTENGSCGHAGGFLTTVDGEYGFAHGYNLTATAYNAVFGKRGKTPTASGIDVNTGDLFVIGCGLGNGAKSNALRVTAAGQVLGTQAYAATGADYAEMFEWLDGNPNAEDRRGLFVILDGEKIRLATPEDDYILGVVSAAPSIIGDACTDDWNGKYVTDEFGARITENDAWKLADDFDEALDESYTSRLERPEWAAVGLVGKLVVRCDDTVQVNGYCTAGANGIATASDTGYRVMSVNNGYARIMLK